MTTRPWVLRFGLLATTILTAAANGGWKWIVP